MPTVASIKEDISNNKKDIIKGALLSVALAVSGVKFIKWAKKEIEGDE